VKARPYQVEAINGAIEQLRSHRSTLITMPTGTGKTVVFSHLIDQILAANPGKRAMVLAHREELINQAASKIKAVTGIEPEIEMGDRRADVHFFGRCPIIVSSVQTQNAMQGNTKLRMTRFNPSDFCLVIIDEAHHAIAESYRRCIAHYSDAKIVGVTATPDRTDGEAMLTVFQSSAFVYGILDAINDGYLVPIRQQQVTVQDLDFSKVRTTAGDFNGRDLADVMEYEAVLHGVAHPTIELAAWRQTIVFASSVHHAERLSEIFNRHRAGCSRWLCGETPKDERSQILSDFANRRFQYLVNVGVLTEGFDDPGIEFVVIARPTKSRSLYAQMVGRGTRPYPGLVDKIDDADGRRAAIAASPKPHVSILDFAGVAGRHKLVTTADVLAGNVTIPDAVMNAVAERMKARDGVDVQKAIEEETAKEAEREKKRQEAANSKKRSLVVGHARYTAHDVDAFDAGDRSAMPRRVGDRNRPASDKQKQLLEKFGYPTEEIRNISAAEASVQIGQYIDRKKKGMCTPKQAKILAARGLDSNVSYGVARTVIDQIAAKEGWSTKRGEVIA